MVRIDFTEISYINYNATIYRNFNVFVLLYIKDITTIFDVILVYNESELLITFYKVFPYFLLARIKLE